MFERFTEKARRVIFFGRYEASQFGQPYIETEHLLLAILREDKALTQRFLRSHAAVESIRRDIEARTSTREKISTSADLPLSNESKRVLVHASNEADQLGHKHIGPEHLLLGLLCEEKCVAAELLGTRGIQLVAVRAELARPEPKLSLPRSQQEPAVLAEFSLNLTEAALEGQLDPLIGRDAQLDQIFQILSRRTDHNAVLIGPPGVGKKTIVAGNDAITAAVHFAGKLLPGFLPGKAVSLLDESGTHINHKPLPEEIRTLQKHIRFIIQRMQAAIANHEFEKARFYSDEERKERDKLKLEVEKYGLGDPEQQIITRDHIEATVSRMTGLSLDTIKKLCPSDSQS